MPKYVCVDIGGTFTDAAVMDDKGKINVFKSPTTPDNFINGIVEVLKVAAEEYGESLQDLLKSCSPDLGGSLTHGSTIATNAVLEGKGAKVGMICTKGFRDVLLFRDGPIKDPFDFQLDYPEPYLPRYRSLPVTERITAEGEIDVPLNEDEVKKAINSFKEWEVEAIAVCLLWSVANPVHERRIKEIIEKEWPGIDVVLSSEVNPCIREYRRWVSAAMDASLRPLISKYTRELNSILQDLGLEGEVGLLNSIGGIVTADEMLLRPLYSIDSGPSLAPVASLSYVQEELGENNFVTLDMGGTSFDVSCSRDGIISDSREKKIGDEIPGISGIDIHSIGAGGGSIAWVDSGGMIRVGPHSAGSDPGPVCYEFGGADPTVTDANVVLGYINPDNFCAGRMKLQRELSEKAIQEKIAEPLGVDLMEAAFTVWTTVNVNMSTAIKDITIRQGIDPREFVMVTGGGAGGIHALPLAEELEMNRILIPRVAGALSASGGVFSDVVSEYSISSYTETRDFDYGVVNDGLRFLVESAQAFFERNNISPEKRVMDFYLEGRYPYQVWEIPIIINDFLTENYELDEEGLNRLIQRFHEEHESVFAVKEEGAYIECIFWRVKAIGKRATKADLTESKKTAAPLPDDALDGYRMAYFKNQNGTIRTPVYIGDKLRYGHKVEGPAIIEEPTTTIVVYPGYSATVTRFDNYLLETNARQ